MPASARVGRPLTCPADAWMPRWLGPGLVAVVFVALALWSWGKWPNVQVDFGNQLYLPWQLTLGKALYRDIDYKEGPLSIYTNASLFLLFGTSLRTLIWFNLGLLALLTAMIHRLFARVGGALSATLACLVLLVVFSFSQYTGGGNYNYVCPYTHEQTHGIVLGVVMIACLGAYLERRALRWAAAAGAALGLVFLTKAELFVPAAVAALAGLALAPLLATETGRRGAALRAAGAFVAAALVPVALCFAFFAAIMPIPLALRGVAGNWVHLGGGILDDPFYVSGLGFDDVAGNLRSMATIFAAIVALVLVAAAADLALARVRGIALLTAPLLALAVAAAFAARAEVVPWRFIGRALPPTSAIAAIAAVTLALRWRRDPSGARFAVLAMWAVYAFALLIKVVLNVRISQYGFVLAMPATLLLVACLVWLVPAALRERGGSGIFAQAVLIGPILAAMLFFFQWSSRLYAQKDLPVGIGGDAFVAENAAYHPRAAMIAAAAERLRGLMPADATLLVLPEGTILNYWLRRSNPTRYTLFTPSAIAFAGGEARILDDFRAHPPDFIALVHRETDEFGVGYFGADPRYGRVLMEWVRREYVRVDGVGAEPLRDRRFGVAILRRAAPAGATN